MRRLTPLWALSALPLVLLASCDLVGYDAVSIRPNYGWDDGCTDVKISGHGFAADVSATIGGAPVDNIVLPDESDELNYGFYFHARTPAYEIPASDGTEEFAPNYASVVVTSDGEDSEITNAFYYVACPGDPYVEAMVPSEGVSNGDTILLAGCNVKDSYKIEIRDPAGVVQAVQADLTSVCGEAHASFTAPDLADGTYEVYFMNAAGDTQIWPGEDCDADTADTAFTAAFCPSDLTITYGGGER